MIPIQNLILSFQAYSCILETDDMQKWPKVNHLEFFKEHVYMGHPFNVDRKYSGMGIFPLVWTLKRMFKYNRYYLVDHIFDTMPLEKMSPYVMICALRSSSPAREKLERWTATVTKCRNELERRGLDSEHLMRGLI